MPSQADIYVNQVLTRYTPRTFAVAVFAPLIREVQAWANQYLLDLKWSGSFAKGTAVAGSSDVDLFVSLHGNVLSGNTPNLASLYTSLHNFLKGKGYPVRPQNVSLRVTAAGFNVDLVPAVKQPGNTNDHSLYKRKTNTWKQTNVDTHIKLIANSGRLMEIRGAKIWRNLRGLDISSFYLELVVLRALKGHSIGNTASNLWEALRFLAEDFVNCAIYDPANTNNCVSDELTSAEKNQIASQATRSRAQPTWGAVIW